jgi:hypothetical protein
MPVVLISERHIQKFQISNPHAGDPIIIANGSHPRSKPKLTLFFPSRARQRHPLARAVISQTRLTVPVTEGRAQLADLLPVSMRIARPLHRPGLLHGEREGELSRQQTGYIWKVGGSWYGRWRDNVVEDGRVVRKQCSVKLADVCDRYRTKADVRLLLAEKLRPVNEGRTRPESTLPVAQFVEKHYLPFVEENFKPSTRAGYKSFGKCTSRPA